MIPHLITKPLATESLVPGQVVYGERLFEKDRKEYRPWDPKRSKLAAAMLKGMAVHIAEDNLVLYLGASTGTTCSHVSDIIRKGMLFGVEFAPRVGREFVLLAETRKNVTPIIADANQPNTYRHLVPQVDLLYQDVAQPNQAEIFLKNARMYLRKGGFGLLMVKSRSIDVTKDPMKVFKKVEEEVSKELKILDMRRLEPFERDHIAILCKKA